MLQGWLTFELSRGVSGIMTSAVPSLAGMFPSCQLIGFPQLLAMPMMFGEAPVQVNVSAAASGASAASEYAAISARTVV